MDQDQYCENLGTNMTFCKTDYVESKVLTPNSFKWLYLVEGCELFGNLKGFHESEKKKFCFVERVRWGGVLFENVLCRVRPSHMSEYP